MRLIIEDDEGHKTVVPFQRDEITIGRGEENTIRLPERNVSRRHCKLTREGGQAFVEDLHSYNGVRVNGERVSGRRAVAAGDVLQIGDYDVSLDADARPEPGPPEQETTQPSMPAVGSPPAPAPVNLVREVKPVPEGERPRLVVIAGLQPGRELVIEKTLVSIGRAADCNLVIEDPSLARTHAQFVLEGGGWKVVEVSAVHAVRVNDEPRAEAPLKDGDVLKLGEVELRWVAPGAMFFWVPPPQPSLTDPSRTPRRRSRLRPVAIAALVVAAAAAAWSLRTAPAQRPPAPPASPGPAPAPPAAVAAAPAPAPAPLSMTGPSAEPPADGLAAQAREQMDKGMRLAQASQCKQAVVFFDRALGLDPNLAEAHKQLGACYAQLRDGENAALHYRRLLELSPDHPSAPQIRRYLETYRQNVTGGPVRSE